MRRGVGLALAFLSVSLPFRGDVIYLKDGSIRVSEKVPQAVNEATMVSAAEDTSIREKARSSRFRDSSGYEEALRLQRSGGKPIALYFYVDWCGYCARFERGILSNQGVKQYLESVLFVSVNPEHGRAEEALFESFRGRGYPTFLILAKNGSGREISTSGSPSDFIQACKKAATQTSN